MTVDGAHRHQAGGDWSPASQVKAKQQNGFAPSELLSLQSDHVDPKFHDPVICKKTIANVWTAVRNNQITESQLNELNRKCINLVHDTAKNKNIKNLDAATEERLGKITSLIAQPQVRAQLAAKLQNGFTPSELLALPKGHADALFHNPVICAKTIANVLNAMTTGQVKPHELDALSALCITLVNDTAKTADLNNLDEATETQLLQIVEHARLHAAPPFSPSSTPSNTPHAMPSPTSSTQELESPHSKDL